MHDKKFDRTEAQASRRGWKGGNVSLCSFGARPRGEIKEVSGRRLLKKIWKPLTCGVDGYDPQTPERQLFYVNSWVVVSVSELFSLGGCCLVLLCGWISDNSTLLTTIQTAFLPGMLQSVAVDLDQPHTKWLFLGKPRVDSASMSTGFVI